MKKKVDKEKKYIPKSVLDTKSWRLSRRQFIRAAVVAGAFSQIGFLSGCLEEKIDTGILSREDFQLIQSVQGILFPKDRYGPGAREINADKYLLWVLGDRRMDPDEKQYLLNGIRWTGETSRETYAKPYNHLNQKQKEKLIEKISAENWGENWLSMLLTFIIEAMISDPIYGYNEDGIGWKWLAHTPGMPRPNLDNKYDNILTL